MNPCIVLPLHTQISLSICVHAALIKIHPTSCLLTPAAQRLSDCPSLSVCLSHRYSKRGIYSSKISKCTNRTAKQAGKTPYSQKYTLSHHQQSACFSAQKCKYRSVKTLRVSFYPENLEPVWDLKENET